MLESEKARGKSYLRELRTNWQIRAKSSCCEFSVQYQQKKSSSQHEDTQNTLQFVHLIYDNNHSGSSFNEQFENLAKVSDTLLLSL
jgi:hypothetical protein